MPFRDVIDKNRRLIISIGDGVLTFDEVKDHQDQLLSNPDFDATFNQLVDLRSVTRLDVSVEEARQIARRSIVSPTSRRALVASKPAIFGMARLMEAYHDQLAKVHVFDDSDSALQWLGTGEDSGSL